MIKFYKVVFVNHAVNISMFHKIKDNVNRINVRNFKFLTKKANARNVKITIKQMKLVKYALLLNVTIEK